jgi:hypothetical protein
MSRVSFISDDSYLGEGASAGIPRGLMVHRGEIDLTQEGLGLGTVALRKNGLAYFPRSSTTSVNGPVIIKEFIVDAVLVFESPMLPISKLMPLYGLGTRAYMMLPSGQEKMLDLRSKMFSRLRVRPEFRRTRPLAKATFIYAIRTSSVTISATVRSMNGALPDVFVMNELGADHFISSIKEGRTSPAPTGWCPLPDGMPSPALMDEEHGVMFLIDRVSGGEEVGTRLYWGRESRGDLCWAGFEIELRNLHGAEEMSVEYEVRFVEMGA